ncbi:MAG: mechanosensitive ion channel [Planctomycetota bacterium]
MSGTPVAAAASTAAQTAAAWDEAASWLIAAAWLAGAVVVGLLLHWVLFRVLARATRREDGDEDDDGKETFAEVVGLIRRPARFVLPLLCCLWVVGPAPLSPAAEDGLRHGLAVLLIFTSTWLLTRVLTAVVTGLLSRYDTSVSDNLEARRVHTRLRVITRVANSLIWVLGVAAILMTFPSIRQLGTTVLASAGIAGIVVGLAAQRTIGNFLAGIQIALTQPVRLDDAVVIAGEWGRVEEITSTYVVVRIWDQRRLIVPFSTLLEQPFQNWTRRSAAMLGQVSLWTDYRVPVQAVRDELRRIVQDCDKWDGETVVLQVVDATDRAVQLRALVSARDSSAAWDLRCLVREELIGFLQREHPEALPVTRAVIEGGEGQPAVEPVGGDASQRST